MAKVKLLFTQTRYDQSNMWTECREVEVDLPDWIAEKCDNFEWHITGMIKEEGTRVTEPCEKCIKKAFVAYWTEDKDYLRCPYCGRPLKGEMK